MSFLRRLAEHRQTLDGEFVPALEAQRFVRRMQEEHPAELAEWLQTHAVRFAAQALNDILRRERQLVVKRASARSFAEAVAGGNVADLHPFQMVYDVGPGHVRRPVGDMTGPDHLFVANRYDDSGLRLIFLAEFHRAVARRVGPLRTSEVISESDYLMMMNSILGRSPSEFLVSTE